MKEKAVEKSVKVHVLLTVYLYLCLCLKHYKLSYTILQCHVNFKKKKHKCSDVYSSVVLVQQIVWASVHCMHYHVHEAVIFRCMHVGRRQYAVAANLYTETEQ